jgi:hypothetical protein
MIVLPPGGGYWLDGQDHECPFDTRGNPILPHTTWHAKFETDDTAKCYRRFFVGRVSNQNGWIPGTMFSQPVMGSLFPVGAGITQST